jgi:hypothetical protein
MTLRAGAPRRQLALAAVVQPAGVAQIDGARPRHDRHGRAPVVLLRSAHADSHITNVYMMSTVVIRTSESCHDDEVREEQVTDQPLRVAFNDVANPPFGGTEACIACPIEVRGLGAVAHNAVCAFEAAASGSGSWERAARKMAELRRAVDEWRPIVEAHFADPMHSHGRPPTTGHASTSPE